MKYNYKFILFGLSCFLLNYEFCYSKAHDIPLNKTEKKILKELNIEIPFKKIEAHDFKGKLIEKKEINLRDNFGNFLIINFWATWCSPCLKEMPDLEKIYNKFKKSGLTVIAISMGESLERVLKFQKKHNYSFPVIIDSDMKISNLYGVKNIPITYLINSNGVIVGRALGPRDWFSDKFIRFLKLQIINS